MGSVLGNDYAFAAQEDRSAPRIRLTIPAMLRPAGGKRMQTVVRDISLSGFSATAISRISVGTTCWLTLPDCEPLQASTVWWEQGVIGCAFAHLLSPELYDKVLVRWQGDHAFRD